MLGWRVQDELLSCLILLFLKTSPWGVEARAEDLDRLYRVTHWTTEDGLPQNKVQCLLQSPDGYLWIGTAHGLARFDGVRFTILDQGNIPGAAHDSITHLAQGTDGSVWATITDGLLHVSKHELTRFTTAEGFSRNRMWHALDSSRSGLWVRTENSLDRMVSGHVCRYAAGQNGLCSSTPTWLSEDPEGNFVIGAGTRMQRFDPATDRFVDYRLPSLAPDLAIQDIQFLPGGEIMVGTATGLYWRQGGEWKRYGKEAGLSDEFVHRVLRSRSGDVWVLTQFGGLHHCEGSRFVRYDLGTRPDPFAVDCLLSDLEGNLWVGTSSGLFRLQPRRVRGYGTREGLPHENCFAVCEAADGSIWVGTDRGLCQIRGQEVTTWPFPDAPPSLTVESVWPDRNGDVWFTVYRGGLYRYSRGQITNVTRQLGIQCYDVGAVYQDRAGSIWFGCSAGVLRLNGTEPKRFTTADGLAENRADAFLQDRAGDIWIANNRGLHRWHNREFSSFTTTNGMSRNATCTLLEDSDGAIWFGTEHGLNRYKDGHFTVFTRRHGLTEDHVNCLVADQQDNLWLGCLRGIYRVSRHQLNAVADGKLTDVRCVAFGEADGMLSSETHGTHQPTAWPARDGRLWFSTGRGVVVIDPRRVQDNDVPPPVVIEKVKADGQVIWGDNFETQPPQANNRFPQNHLPAGRARVLEIRYTANSFVAPERVRFKYQLEGHDQQCREVDSRERIAFYTDLRPGRYTFRVRACNNHGIWNEAGDSFTFSLAPHVYETWPFYVTMGAVLIGLAGGVQAYRMKVQRRILRLEQQQALEQERTRIAQDMHDDLGASLTKIAILSEVARKDLTNSGAAQVVVERISIMARRVVDNISELVWATNPSNDSLDNLTAFLREYAARYFEGSAIQLHLDFATDPPAMPISGAFRRTVLLVVKEALHNVVKHSTATKAEVSLLVQMGARDQSRGAAPVLEIGVHDNGCGFDPNAIARFSNGLQNMRRRVKDLAGTLELHAQPGHGAHLRIILPLNPIQCR